MSPCAPKRTTSCDLHVVTIKFYPSDVRWVLIESSEENRFQALDPECEWDEELASDLLGATLFVGITNEDGDGNLIGREQVFGTVESISPGAGIKLIQSNGEPYILAPVLESIEVGDRDDYQLSENDELVRNPDFVAWITATHPSRH